jgi:hypothetical protein
VLSGRYLECLKAWSELSILDYALVQRSQYLIDPELVLQLQALRRVGAHAGLETLVASLASMFGPVGRICRLLLKWTTQGDPGADGSLTPMPTSSHSKTCSTSWPL